MTEPIFTRLRLGDEMVDGAQSIYRGSVLFLLVLTNRYDAEWVIETLNERLSSKESHAQDLEQVLSQGQTEAHPGNSHPRHGEPEEHHDSRELC